MSSPLAIGAVSAVLRNVLDDGIVASAPLPMPVKVTASAPDTIRTDVADFAPQLNIFLFQVTPNAAWRNSALPSRSAGGERLTNPPLALDLHYLVTAYGAGDFQAEVLLGYAMHLLHERPMLDRAAIRRALQPGTLDVAMLPPMFQVLSQSDLADQVEAIRITPSAMGVDEMSKLWSAIKSDFRPSAVYQVSVVLIEARTPTRHPLPVLQRGLIDPLTQRDMGVAVQADLLPTVPTLFDAVFAAKQVVARLGETVSINGHRLGGAGATALLRHRLLAAPLELPVTINAAGSGFNLVLPDTPAAQADFPPGLWQIALRVTPPGAAGPVESNGIALPLAAAPVLPPVSVLRAVVAPSTQQTVTVTLQTRPQVRPGQRAVLALDGGSAEAADRLNSADPLVFSFPASLPAGARWARLRVDGVDSPLLRRDTPQPVFDVSQQVTVPA